MSVRIEGVKRNCAGPIILSSDRIEAGAFIGRAPLCERQYVENALSEHLKPLVAKLKEVGATVEEDMNGIRVIRHKRCPADIKDAAISRISYGYAGGFMA